MMLSFDKTVDRAITEVISNVFEDEEVSEIIFQCLNKISYKGIDERIQFFSETLPKILGPGAIIIEDLILENLYSKHGVDLEWKRDYRFKDYVIELRNRIKMDGALIEV